MPAIAMLTKVTVLPHLRAGRRPRMPRALPHVQFDQLPSAETMEEFVERCLSMPCVRSKQSRMASPGCHALYLADACAAGPPEAFIDGHEFCHIHPLPEGSIHLTLPGILREEVVRLGWGEPHLLAMVGIFTSLITVYAPRDRQEIDTVCGLVLQSCEFAHGKLRDLCIPERSLRESR